MAKSGGVAGTALAGMGLGAGFIGFTALTSAVSGTVAALDAAVTAAREDEASIATLTQAIAANDAASVGNIDSIEATIDARTALGFADEEQRAGLQRLVSVTKDSDTALRLQATAMDLARLRGMDLLTASDLIGKVYGGNIGILSRYGIQLERGTTATEALAEIQKRASGQAEAYGETSLGIAETSTIAWEELSEELGMKLLPILTDLAVFSRDVLVPALSEMVKLLEIGNQNSADGIPILQELEDGLNGIAESAIHVGSVIRGNEDTINSFAESTGQTYLEAHKTLKDYADAHDVNFARASEAILAHQANADAALADNAERTGLWKQQIAGAADEAASSFDAATDEMVADAGDTPGEMAKALSDGREAWRKSWEEMENAATDEMNKARTVRRLLARLHSQELLDGLMSKDEERRLWAEQTRADLMEALRINGYDLGSNFVGTFATGISENQWKAQNAARGLAQVTRDVMVESEPKDPLSPLRGVTKLGAKLVDTIVASGRSELGTARAFAHDLAGALNPALVGSYAPAGAPSRAALSGTATAPSGSLQAYPYGPGAGGGSVVNLAVTYAPSAAVFVDSPASREQAGRVIADLADAELTRRGRLVRQSGRAS